MSLTARIEMTPGWEAGLDQIVAAGMASVFHDRLGPAIVGDAQLLVPIDTARLHNSLGHTVDSSGRMPVLIVGSFPDAEGEVAYAAAVELGFVGVEQVRAHVRRGPDGRPVKVRAHTRNARTREQPYMRPALFLERDL